MNDSDFQAIPNYATLRSQLNGISASIDKYTSDAPITSTRQLLEDSLEIKDMDGILYACKEIASWYEKNIDSIKSSKFVFNADTHEDNMRRLPHIISTIEDNEEWFTSPVNSCDIPTQIKQKLIFISHSTKDSEYVASLVDLLRKIGFTDKDVFCSSYPGYGVPLGKNIYEFLKNCFKDYELFVLFVISKDNYYSSPASLNEMGAAWVQGAKSIPILLPGMSPAKLKGVVGPDSLAICLDSDNVRYDLNSLKNDLLLFFGKQQINESAWEHDRESFLESCFAITPLSPEEIRAIESANENTVLNDLVEDRVSLEKSLYRALVIAKQNQNKPLEGWIRSELKGYESDDDLPDYRKTKSSNFRYSGINGSMQVTKAPLPMGFIRDEILDKVENVEYRQGIRQIEEFANSTSTITIDRSLLAGEVAHNTQGVVQCVSLEQLLPTSFFSALAANVKERLIEVFMNNCAN
ncbi:TIR domain-containing protein [Sutterella wadsworthensis]|uniref:AbiTii domain-containing protein n=1 Tax=Sutterella wadsworthensis TaxID=40545 RepID=UPI003966C1D2